jgi:beta-lactamase regulating signal transducer with metallopeptidase domain/uncharacterized protein YihD (DUF1040 family)
MIEQMNHIGQLWWSWMGPMFWQVSVLIVLIGAIDLLLRRWAWPQVRYALWLLVLVKLVLPPGLSLPTSVTSPFQPWMDSVINNPVSEHPQMFALTSPAVPDKNTPDPHGFIAPDVKSGDSSTGWASDPHGLIAPDVKLGGSSDPQVDLPPNRDVTKPMASSEPSVPVVWQVYALVTWLVGMWIFTGWLIVRLRHLRRVNLRNQDQTVLPEWFASLLTHSAERLKLRRIPKVVLTNSVITPAVFGLFRPVLLMPADRLAKLSRQDAEHILLHELAHIKRGDLLVHGFYILLQIVYWFNPLLWLVRRQMQHLRELCCDATVARILRERTSEYRDTLLETARELLAKPVEPGLGLLGLFEDSNRLLTRLRWLEKKTWRHHRLRIATICAIVALMAACVLPMAQADIGSPALVIKGTVTDSLTGQPIAGAKVGDVEKYADGQQWTTTDSNGNYSYKTWYEEHSVKVEADGYKQQLKGFNTKLFGSEKGKVIDFALEKGLSEKLEASDIPAEFVGHWKGQAKIVVNWTKQRYLGIDIAINPDGSVTGRIGDSETKDARFSLKSDLYLKWLKHAQRYIITGQLSGPIIKNEDISRKKFTMGLDITDTNTLEGQVGTSGFLFGAKKLEEMLIAHNMKLEKVSPDGEDPSQFTAQLPNGVTVELVGLGTAPWKTEQQWWKPDGTNLNQPALKFPYLFQWKDHPNGWQFTCTALCKYSNYTGKEISVPDVKFSKEELLTRVWGTDFTMDGYEMTYIASNPSIGTVPDKTDMRLAVGSKQFIQAKRLGKNYTPKQHQIHYLEKNSDQIILHPVRIGSVGTPCVDLTCKQENKEIEFRIFAKLKNGETEQWHGGGVGKDVLFFQSKPKSQNTTIEDIEDIIIEFRPYEWVTFKNVSLKPGRKTNVQVEVEKPSVDVKGEVDTANIHLLGLRPDAGDDIYDVKGNKIQKTFGIARWDSPSWGKEDQRCDFIFELPKTSKPIHSAFFEVKPAGANTKLSSGVQHKFIEVGDKTLHWMRLNIPRKYKKKLFGNIRRNVSIEKVDLRMVWFTGETESFEKEFTNISFNFSPRTKRDHAEYLDKMAERLGLEGLSVEELERYQFKDADEAMKVIDVIRGTLIRSARDAILYGENKLDFAHLDKESSRKLRETLKRWMGAIDPEIQEIGRKISDSAGWVEFKNVSLKPNFKTDVQIEVDSEVQRAFIPDADTKGADVVLDLTTSRMLPPGDGKEQLTGVFKNLGKGDLAYDRMLICLRGGKAELWNGKSVTHLLVAHKIQDATAYKLKTIPCRLLITTAEGNNFDVTVLSKDKNGINIKYHNATLKPGHKPDVQIEVEKGDRVGQSPTLPIGYWNFDGNAKDSIGNNHGTVYGATLTEGISGQAYYFEGDGDCISIPDSAKFDFGGGDFTISTWFRTNVNKAPFPFIVNFRQNDNNPHIELYASRDVGSHSLPGFTRLTYRDAGINDDKWHHMVIALKNRAKDGYKLYLDGFKVSESTYVGRLEDWDTITIGAQRKGGNDRYAFKGFIDEVAIYSRALSGDEIKDLYDAMQTQCNEPKPSSNIKSKTVSIKESYSNGLVAYWRFNEGSGNIAHDSAGNNNAIVQGANWSNGISGAGLNFDGIDDYVNCGSNAGLDLTEFTWLLWIKRTEQWYSDERALISTNKTGQNTKGSYGFQIDEGGNYQNKIQFVRHGDPFSGCLWSNTTIGDTTWHHIAATRNNKGEAVLYIDGEPETQGLLQARTAFKEVSIGAGDKAYSNFKGVIDEVAIYNRALSAEEIQNIYNTIQITEKPDRKTDVQVEENKTDKTIAQRLAKPFQRTSRLKQRTESMGKLRKIGLALVIYANEHNEKYPDSLDKLKSYIQDDVLDWAKDNIVYLGRGKSITADPQTAIAYDKTLLKKENSQGTNVLYNDTHVAFRKTKQLKQLGLIPKDKIIQRVWLRDDFDDKEIHDSVDMFDFAAGKIIPIRINTKRLTKKEIDDRLFTKIMTTGLGDIFLDKYFPDHKRQLLIIIQAGRHIELDTDSLEKAGQLGIETLVAHLRAEDDAKDDEWFRIPGLREDYLDDNKTGIILTGSGTVALIQFGKYDESAGKRELKYIILGRVDMSNLPEPKLITQEKLQGPSSARRQADVSVEDKETREKVSSVIGADLPKSVTALKSYWKSFMDVDIGLIRFDIPLPDLKILLEKSVILPDFSELKKDPLIKKHMKDYQYQNVKWWKPDELKNAVYAEWSKTEKASQDTNSPLVYKNLQISVSAHSTKIADGEPSQNQIMRIYIKAHGETFVPLSPNSDGQVEVIENEKGGSGNHPMVANQRERLEDFLGIRFTEYRNIHFYDAGMLGIGDYTTLISFEVPKDKLPVLLEQSPKLPIYNEFRVNTQSMTFMGQVVKDIDWWKPAELKNPVTAIKSWCAHHEGDKCALYAYASVAFAETESGWVRVYICCQAEAWPSVEFFLRPPEKSPEQADEVLEPSKNPEVN